ncbi:MAG: hypothetical protein ABSD72_00805 [Terracidiphilus sp.]|jgi:hypothetical protein
MRSALSIFALLLASYGPMFAKTHYIAAGGGSDSNPGTLSKPWATFTRALAEMAPCDTLIVGDGYYYDAIKPQSNNNGNTSGSGCYTVIEAATPWGVTVDASKLTPQPNGAIYMYRNSYIQVVGIKFAGNPSFIQNGTQTQPVFINASDHIKLQQTAAFNAPCSENTNAYTIGPASSYVLVEDSHAWGCGRYKFEVYQSDHVILRRDVSRHDYQDLNSQWWRQCANFTSYDSTDILLQNDIAIDSGFADNSTGKLWGGLWVENNRLVENILEVDGSIFLNLRGIAGINDEKEGGTHTYNHDAVWDVAGGLQAGYLPGVKETPTLVAQHMTFGDISGKAQDCCYGWGTGSESNSANFISQSTTNSVIQQAESFGISNYMTSDYNVFYKNAANYGTNIYQGPMPKPGAHDRTMNPHLKYITRAEAGSPLIGTASDGGNIGATILYSIGKSGTLWGDAGYDTITSAPLWPFPNEATIKTDMASYTGPGAKGARGFAASGVGLYGGPITLTSYIWEYLGNICPHDICPGGSR